MNESVEFIKVTSVHKRRYLCFDCGVILPGEVETMESDSIDDLMIKMAVNGPNPRLMPVGWSSWPGEVNYNTLEVNLDKLIGPEKLTDEEIVAIKKTRDASRIRERAAAERLRQKQTHDMIRELKDQLQKKINKGERMRLSVDYNGRSCDVDLVKKAFPNARVYRNSNECSSDEPSIDVDFE